MDVEIHELRSKKFTIEEIAEKLGITVGQVKYRLYKKNSVQPSDVRTSTTAEVTREDQEIEKYPSTPFIQIPNAPQYYGENDIVMIVQGPTAVYVYWEITWPVYKMVGDFLNVPFEALPRTARVYDVTDIWFDGTNAHWYREIQIDDQANDWFVYDLLPARTYVIDLGVSWQGRFIPILRSKPKSTPGNQPVFSSPQPQPIAANVSTERVKPQWFENFCTYTLY